MEDVEWGEFVGDGAGRERPNQVPPTGSFPSLPDKTRVLDEDEEEEEPECSSVRLSNVCH